jgi:hypothetical protein
VIAVAGMGFNWLKSNNVFAFMVVKVAGKISVD